jgi:DNA recombination protein RmuC
MNFGSTDPALLAYGGIGLAVVFLALVVYVLMRQERSRAEMTTRFAQVVENQQSSQLMIAQRLIDQERAVQENIDRLSQRIGGSLDQAATQTRETLAALRERLAVMDQAQRNITELSSQMVGLQDILSNKQARGAFGEMQLRDLVEAVLPPDTYEFQATLGDGFRVDCLIHLPNPPGSIAIDAKFPLESYQRLVNAATDPERIQAARDFSADILRHVRAIRDKYIVPGATGEAALMFLPSEAVYAELHARYANVVEQSFRDRVFIVSPTTLWATLNTIRAIFRDVRLREQAGVLQRELHTLMEDVGRLDERVNRLGTHFRQANRDVDEVLTSTRKIVQRAERIQSLDLAGEGSGGEATPELPMSPSPKPAPATPRIVAKPTQPGPPPGRA